MYRYGDGTPFPFEENFIDIVGAAVDACAGMFTAAAQLEALRAKAREAKREADVEGAKLAALERSIEGAVALSSPSVAKDATLVQQTALRALEGARHAITLARGTLEKRTAAVSAEPRVDRAMQSAFAAAASFFDTHHLPRTAWSWSWKANVGGTAMAHAAKFTVSFDLPDVPWTGPARLASLIPGTVVRLPHRRLLGKPAPQKIHLDRGALLEVEREGDEITMVVREHASKKSAGWGIHLDSLSATAATVTLLDDDGSLSGVEMVIGGDDGVALARLAAAVVDEMEPALARRRTRDVTIGKTALRTMVDPSEPAKALLDLLAPTIRTMCQKSRVPGEISLKRDVADGRREELFVSRQSLAAKYASLPPEYRQLFDAAGLG
ncbi:MAG: hypothetical protein K8M05_00205, partial [Deltaproteobacteria bacterium]|nr:hypothetical protein [Kofleriaceae bacterium]